MSLTLETWIESGSKGEGGGAKILLSQIRTVIVRPIILPQQTTSHGLVWLVDDGILVVATIIPR